MQFGFGSEFRFTQQCSPIAEFRQMNIYWFHAMQ